MTTLTDLDITDPAFRADPFPTYVRLRAEHPVFGVQLPRGETAYLITRYDDVTAALVEGLLKNRHNALTPEQLGRGPKIPAIPVVEHSLSALERGLLSLDGDEHDRRDHRQPHRHRGARPHAALRPARPDARRPGDPATRHRGDRAVRGARRDRHAALRPRGRRPARRHDTPGRHRPGRGLLANRDPDHFTDPDVLDLGRRPNRHLSFGKGGHSCLGASLARLEASVALPTLLRRVPALRLGVPEDRLRWRRDPRGLRELPVSVR